MKNANTRSGNHGNKTIRHTAGDAAVDGLIQGLIAGMLMLVFLILFGWRSGRPLAETLELFSPWAATGPVAGALAHLAVSSIYGACFSIALRRLRGSGWSLAAGPGYGLLLLWIANAILLPTSGSPLASLDLAPFTGAHLIYGLVLGWLTFRSGN